MQAASEEQETDDNSGSPPSAAAGSGTPASAHVAPDRTSIRGIPADKLDPTAAQNVAEVQEMPLSFVQVVPGGRGGVCDVQIDPVSATMSACPPCVLASFPTATHRATEVHETPKRAAGAGPVPNDVVAVHVEPESVSAKPAFPTVPTATQALIEVQDTEYKVPEDPPGDPSGNGRGAYLQVEPVIVPASGNVTGFETPTVYDPTAMQDVADRQDTPSNCAPDHPGWRGRSY